MCVLTLRRFCSLHVCLHAFSPALDGSFEASNLISEEQARISGRSSSVSGSLLRDQIGSAVGGQINTFPFFRGALLKCLHIAHKVQLREPDAFKKCRKSRLDS